MSAGREDFERMKLVELAQFVLNRETEDMRSELHEYLVCHAIYHKSKDRSITKSEIQAALREIYEMIVPMNIIEESVQRLKAKNALIVQNGREPTYLLSEDRLKQVASHHLDYENLRQTVISLFVARVREACPSVNNDLEISDILFCTVSKIFSRYGSICSDLITGTKGAISDVQNLPDFQQICVDCVRRLTDPTTRKIVKDTLATYFMEPTAEFVYFLNSLAQAYTITQVLVLDPELQNLARGSLARKKLFLDTNVLVSLMCIAQDHETVTEIISLTNKLGVKMVYTPETRTEFLGYLDYSKKLYERIPVHKKSIIDKTKPLMDNPFIKSFWTESEEKTVKWQGFVTKMEGFQKLLADKFSILLETPPKQIFGDKRYEEWERAVYLADIYKQEPAIIHDAYHLRMIEKSRENEAADELGEMSYFLTRDYSLSKAERIVGRGGAIPSSLSIDIWPQMIMPFLSPQIVIDQVSDVYAKILGSKFPVLNKAVDSNDLVDIMGMWMDDPSVTTEVLRKIVGDRFVRERLGQLRAAPEVESSKVARLMDPILSRAVSSASDANQKLMSEQKEEYEKKMAEMEKRLEGPGTPVDKPSKINKSLFITGLGLFAILIILALIAAHVKLLLQDAFFYALAFAGITLIASSVFGARVVEKFRGPS